MSQLTGPAHAHQVLWSMLKRRMVLLVAVTVTVFVAGTLLASSSQTVYEATTEVTFAPRADAPASADLVRLLVGSKYALYASSSVAVDPVAEDLDISASALDRALDVVVPTNSGAVEISVQLPEPVVAAAAANALADAVVVLSGSDPLVEGSVIAAAQPPSSPSGPSTLTLAVASLLLGVALGVGAALLVEQADPRLRTDHELSTETGVPVLGRLAASAAVDRRPAEVLVDPLLGVQLRMLRANLGPMIGAGREDHEPAVSGVATGPEPRGNAPGGSTITRHRTRRHGVGTRRQEVTRRNGQHSGAAGAARARTIAVVSPGRGDGRTTMTLLLGAVLARGGASVLLIDGNVRSPGLHERLDIPPDGGLVESLRRGRSLAPQGYVGLPGLFVVPTVMDISAGDVIVDGFAEALSSVVEDFDVILVDTPSLLASDEARTIAAVTDESLLIVPTLTSRQDASAARAVLDVVGSHVVGAVLNRAAVGSNGARTT